MAVLYKKAILLCAPGTQGGKFENGLTMPDLTVCHQKANIDWYALGRVCKHPLYAGTEVYA